MAELSKCCGASNVANIAVPSNIAKRCRVFIKKKSRKFANVAEPTDVMDFSDIAVLSMVAIIAKTLRMLQMLQRLSEKESKYCRAYRYRRALKCCNAF